MLSPWQRKPKLLIRILSMWNYRIIQIIKQQSVIQSVNQPASQLASQPVSQSVNEWVSVEFNPFAAPKKRTTIKLNSIHVVQKKKKYINFFGHWTTYVTRFNGKFWPTLYSLQFLLQYKFKNTIVTVLVRIDR